MEPLFAFVQAEAVFIDLTLLIPGGTQILPPRPALWPACSLCSESRGRAAASHPAVQSWDIWLSGEPLPSSREALGVPGIRGFGLASASLLLWQLLSSQSS